jgi:hypothetical protein
MSIWPRKGSANSSADESPKKADGGPAFVAGAPEPTDSSAENLPNKRAPGDLLLEVQQLAQTSAQLAQNYHKLAKRLVNLASPPAAAAAPPELLQAFHAWETRWQLLESRLAAIEQTLHQRNEPQQPPAITPETFSQFAEGINRQLDSLKASSEQGQGALLRALEDLRQLVTPVEPPPAPVTVVSDEWRRALLGKALADDDSLRQRWTEVCTGVLLGDEALSVLVGYLLLFRHLPPERRPQLLGPLGEAYYRRYPKTEDGDSPLEVALANWLQRTCEQAGFSNSIELVHLGDRFDSSRHTPTKSGGVDVCQVHGWVVLRDRDKVYHKALVTLR